MKKQMHTCHHAHAPFEPDLERKGEEYIERNQYSGGHLYPLQEKQSNCNDRYCI